MCLFPWSISDQPQMLKTDSPQLGHLQPKYFAPGSEREASTWSWVSSSFLSTLNLSTFDVQTEQQRSQLKDREFRGFHGQVWSQHVANEVGGGAEEGGEQQREGGLGGEEGQQGGGEGVQCGEKEKFDTIVWNLLSLDIIYIQCLQHSTYFLTMISYVTPLLLRTRF